MSLASIVSSTNLAPVCDGPLGTRVFHVKLPTLSLNAVRSLDAQLAASHRLLSECCDLWQVPVGNPPCIRGNGQPGPPGSLDHNPALSIGLVCSRLKDAVCRLAADKHRDPSAHASVRPGGLRTSFKNPLMDRRILQLLPPLHHHPVHRMISCRFRNKTPYRFCRRHLHRIPVQIQSAKGASAPKVIRSVQSCVVSRSA